MKITFATILLAELFLRATAAQAIDHRVLIIGIDGAGGNYLQNANIPNIDASWACRSRRWRGC